MFLAPNCDGEIKDEVRYQTKGCHQGNGVIETLYFFGIEMFFSATSFGTVAR